MFHSSVASALTVEPLGNNNYFMWSARMEWLLTSKNQWAAVISDDAPELECRQARATIGLYVTGPHMATVKRSKTPRKRGPPSKASSNPKAPPSPSASAES